MADKKLNEVTKVTDMAYVPVIMSDGSIGQIAKDDLASVVAELFALKFRFKEFSVSAGAEVETGIIQSGIYYIYTTETGYAALFPLGSQPVQPSALIGSSEKHSYSTDLEEDGKICINRKANNKSLYIKNNMSSTRSVRIYVISRY